MSLKTDYKDFELAPDMGGKKRYKMINNDDGTVSFVDVSEYLEIGDAFKAEDINTTNSEVNELLSELNSKLSVINIRVNSADVASSANVVSWLNANKINTPFCGIINFVYGGINAIKASLLVSQLNGQYGGAIPFGYHAYGFASAKYWLNDGTWSVYNG